MTFEAFVFLPWRAGAVDCSIVRQAVVMPPLRTPNTMTTHNSFIVQLGTSHGLSKCDSPAQASSLVAVALQQPGAAQEPGAAASSVPEELQSTRSSTSTAGLTTNAPTTTAFKVAPELPADVLRMIWQAKWRGEAACILHRAWRACRMRRAWARMRGRWCMLAYVLRYITKCESYYVMTEWQSRGMPHTHMLL